MNQRYDKLVMLYGVLQQYFLCEALTEDQVSEQSCFCTWMNDFAQVYKLKLDFQCFFCTVAMMQNTMFELTEMWTAWSIRWRVLMWLRSLEELTKTEQQASLTMTIEMTVIRHKRFPVSTFFSDYWILHRHDIAMMSDF